jgi:predicted amidophosphoribosyltransferase
MFCPKCGTTIKEGAKFCGGCGAKVEAKPPAAAFAPAPAAMAGSGDTCAACGKPVEVEWKVCPFCKAALVRERRCGNCGRKLEPEWNACPFCGTEAAGMEGVAAAAVEAVGAGMAEATEEAGAAGTTAAVRGGRTGAGIISPSLHRTAYVLYQLR